MLNAIKRTFKNRKLICALKRLGTEDAKEIIHYLRKNESTYFNYDWFKYSAPEYELRYDPDVEVYYTMVDSKKMYLKAGWDQEQCRKYLDFLFSEQLSDSPHYYFDKNILTQKYNILVDGGGAEGYFALRLLDNAEKIYIFECDAEWVVALQKTFAAYKAKVIIIDKYLGAQTDGNVIALDDVIDKDEKISLLKLDVEGAELATLEGAVQSIDDNTIGLVWVYHYQNEENEIRKFLKKSGYYITNRKGYIYFLHDENMKAPYFRRGVLKFYRKVQ